MWLTIYKIYKLHVNEYIWINWPIYLVLHVQIIFIFLAISFYFNFFSKNVCCFYNEAAAAAAKSLQSCPTLCDPIDGSPPGSSVPGILLARTLEWVAISFSNARKWKVKVKSLSGVRLFATPWTAVYQDPPSLGFSRQEYWSGVPLLSSYNETMVVKSGA